MKGSKYLYKIRAFDPQSFQAYVQAMFAEAWKKKIDNDIMLEYYGKEGRKMPKGGQIVPDMDRGHYAKGGKLFYPHGIITVSKKGAGKGKNMKKRTPVKFVKKARDIDSKFAVSTDGRIYKKSNGEIVPDDEPLFLLRGRDLLASKFLAAYLQISIDSGCNSYHFSKLAETTAGFAAFRKHHPGRMKMPSITEGR